MNILFLSELFHPHGGGAELATYLYAKLLSEAGVNVTVVTNRFAGELPLSKSQNLIVYRLPLFKGTESVKYSILRRIDVLSSSFMKKLIKWADVVYVPRFWFSAIPLAKAHRKPVVTHIHDYIPICPLSNLYDASKDAICNARHSMCSSKCIYAYEKIGKRSLYRILYSIFLNSTLGWYFHRIVGLSDAIVFVSNAQKDLVIMNHGNLVSRSYMIYNPLPDAPPVDVQGEDFGYFGGFSYLKGFHVLCQAIKRINLDGNRAIHVHATGFSGTSSHTLDALNKGGFAIYERLGEEQFKEVYKSIKCVIVPSIWPETFSYAAVEALLYGRIVIASEVGALPEVTSHCDGVFLFSASNVEELVDRLVHVRDLNKESAVDLGLRNRRVVKRKFNSEKTIGEFLRLLHDVSDKNN